MTYEGGDNDDGTVTYTPDPDFNGMDTFTYFASDGFAHSPIVTVTITVAPVNDNPVAVDDSYVTGMNSTLNEPAPGVLANDSDVDMDPLSTVLVSPPVTGALALQPDGAFDYTPALNFAGVVTFTYQANDGMGGLSPTATVTITVRDDLPIVDAGSDQIVEEGSLVSFTGTYTNPAPTSGDLIHWDFGDTTILTGTLTPTHTYLDNGVYSVTLIVTNTLGKTGQDMLVVTVTNVAPSVVAGPDQTVLVSETVTVNATFTDPGVLDTHTAMITWGDGTAPQPATVDPATKTVTGSHVYGAQGNYTVQITVTDNAGDFGTDTLRIIVGDEQRIYLPLVIR